VEERGDDGGLGARGVAAREERLDDLGRLDAVRDVRLARAAGLPRVRARGEARGGGDRGAREGRAAGDVDAVELRGRGAVAGRARDPGLERGPGAARGEVDAAARGEREREERAERG
jgi:hypothetical protein